MTINSVFIYLVLLLFCACTSQKPVDPPQESASESTEAIAVLDSVSAASHSELLQEGTLKAGESLEKLCHRLNLKREETLSLCRQINRIHDARKLKQGQPWQLLRDANQQRWLCLADGSIRRFRLGIDQDSCAVDSLYPEQRLRVAEGAIESSLYMALQQAGGDPATVVRFAQIFQWDVDFLMDVRRGDRFWLVWEQNVYRGGWLKDSLQLSGRILAAEYEGRDGLFRACWWENSGRGGYYDEQGQSLQKRFLKSPLNYSRISSTFGNRYHPILKRVKLHSGVDFSAPRGTPVVSSADGIIRFVGWLKGFGRTVKVAHGDRYLTVYGHLNSYAKGLKKGQHITQNQLIAYVGSSGLATGPHLHYELHDRGHSINPLQLKNAAAKPIPDRDLVAFMDLFRSRFPEFDPAELAAME